MKLKGKVAIITGSARAIGQSYAVRLAREGAKVVVCDILDCDETVKAIVSFGGEVLSVKTDVSDEGSTLEMAKKTADRFGKIDILINNAAIYANIVRKPFYQINVKEWDSLMSVNLRGVFLCCKAVFPYMKEKRKGKIINIASAAALSGGFGFAHYTASKGGVLGLTRALAHELGEHNININALAPGLTLTEYNLPQLSKEYQQAAMAKRALKRSETPDDLLGTMVFLASDDSDFLTGQTIVVDGGVILH